VDVWAPFAVRGSIGFPRGTVNGLAGSRFSRVVGRDAVKLQVRGSAVRAAAPRLTLSAEPLVRSALPAPGARTLEAAVGGYLRYARVGQFQAFLANPDARGRSATTYVYETAAPRPAARPQRPDDDRGLPAALVIGGLVVLAAAAVVLWSHL